MNIDLSAFSHGQLLSKIWLCEHLEPHLPEQANVFILGSWYNLLGSLMLSRNRKLYDNIVGIDIDPDAVNMADKICEPWIIEKKLSNIVGDVSNYDLQGPQVIINCSLEHMDSTNWFNNINKGTLVCLQTSDVVDASDPWFIKQPSPNIGSFLNRYQLTKNLYIGTKKFEYPSITYNRFMLIGIR